MRRLVKASPLSLMPTLVGVTCDDSLALWVGCGCGRDATQVDGAGATSARCALPRPTPAAVLLVYVPDARRRGFGIGFCLRRARGVREQWLSNHIERDGPTPSASPRAALRLQREDAAPGARVTSS